MTLEAVRTDLIRKVALIGFGYNFQQVLLRIFIDFVLQYTCLLESIEQLNKAMKSTLKGSGTTIIIKTIS